MKVFIRRANTAPYAVWIVVERENEEGRAYTIREDEIEYIRNACNAWLEEESQRIMKEGIE